MISRSSIGTAILFFAIAGTAAAADDAPVPGDRIDLSEWKITLPIDGNKDGKVDEIKVKDIQDYSHPDFFYVDEHGHVVFTAPNKGALTANTTNTRSELRHMLRGKNTRIKTHSPQNNFAVEARKSSNLFGRVGGRMEATLHVDHVARRAGEPAAKAAYSAVVGQIHATRYDNTSSGFGYGNEPLKIYYKKFPDHEYGSLFWTYERNLPKSDPNRTDIAYPVFGYTWDDDGTDPGPNGIKLGEDFSYTVNVHRNTMYLTFESDRHDTVSYSLNLANQRDAYGEIDPLDNQYSYGGGTHYFKAGVYNQCSTKTGGGYWYAGCPGTGEWETDKANGDYAQVSFSRLVTGESTPPSEG